MVILANNPKTVCWNRLVLKYFVLIYKPKQYVKKYWYSKWKIILIVWLNIPLPTYGTFNCVCLEMIIYAMAPWDLKKKKKTFMYLLYDKPPIYVRERERERTMG